MHPKVATFLNSTKSPKRISFSWEYDLDVVPAELINCWELEDLDLSYTAITNIPDFVFELPKLKKLSYIGCDIKILPNGIGLLSERLLDLSISIDNLEDADALYTLHNLKKLTIHGSFDSIPDRIKNLQKIEELTIISVELKKLPETFGFLKRLKKINLVGEIGLDIDPKLDIEQFFSQIAQCEALNSLSIDSYRLHVIPSKVGFLIGLESLCLRNNLLKTVPDELFNLFTLKELDLSINKIKSISPKITKLENLKVLNLSSNWENQIDCRGLFSEIERLKKIEVLDFSSCQSITDIPEGIIKLAKLKSLDFDNNLISKLPEFLYGMHNLKKLRVSTNNIPENQIERLKETLSDVNVIG